MASALCPPMAWSGPILVNKQDGQMAWRWGFGELLRVGSHPSKGKWTLCSPQGTGSQALWPFCSTFFFFFFGPHKCWRKGREGRFVSNWFQEAGARPLFFQSKAETVHIRTRSMKSILRGSVCVCRMGWGLVLTTIISRLSPLPGPEAGSHTPPSSPCPKAAAEEPSTNHRGPRPQSHSA